MTIRFTIDADSAGEIIRDAFLKDVDLNRPFDRDTAEVSWVCDEESGDLMEVEITVEAE